MYRDAINDLYKWKSKKNKKPLIIEGARQVGKTWLMKEFGKEAYDNVVYINFDSNTQMTNLFSLDYNIERLIKGLELYSNEKILSTSTLIIFDEIQEVPNALESLKYFNENAPEYDIICAGSLLGIALHQGTSFPVGKVEFLNLYPLSYVEFLRAINKEQFAKLLIEKDYELINAFSNDYIETLKQYYIVGGMPEVVNSFVSDGNFNNVKDIQRRILMAYEQDFFKHAPSDIVPKIRMVFNSIPSQLAKENKKFIYGLIREGARAKDFETAIMWLSDCGLVYKAHRVNKAGVPLKAYEDLKAFKLFMHDIGLLCCMANVSEQTILNKNDLFVEFKGSLTEQYVCQQLKNRSDLGIYYYTNEKNTCEVDFVVDDGTNIIPIEVKAETNLKAKSLKTFCDKFKPNYAIRSSLANYKKEDNLINLPLYAIANLC